MRGERGSGTVAVLGVLGVAVVLLGLVSLAVTVVTARARAQSAADLAALTAASVLYGVSGAELGEPCAAAARVAALSGGTLTSCAVSGGFANVEASVETPLGLAVAHALAGPA